MEANGRKMCKLLGALSYNVDEYAPFTTVKLCNSGVPPSPPTTPSSESIDLIKVTRPVYRALHQEIKNIPV